MREKSIKYRLVIWKMVFWCFIFFFIWMIQKYSNCFELRKFEISSVWVVCIKLIDKYFIYKICIFYKFG